ncbi:MAG: SPOR domain-containing protein [Gammaproteobacteria bacterium]|nr:SPOR domain-containing protein [Gammaproteobacteria bacterium]
MILRCVDPLSMVQDFAKIKPEPVLEKRSIEAPPAWSLLFTGLITGIAVGVFGCFLLYLSGNIPPLQAQTTAETPDPESEPVRLQATAVVTGSTDSVTEESEDTLDLGFYEELKNFVVEVDATPVPLESTAENTDEPAEEPTVTVETVPNEPESGNISNGRLIQIGAFQIASSAQTQLGIVRSLGVDAFITQYTHAGRTLHAVQAGPFSSTSELNEIRALLQRNDIDSIFVDRR